MAQTTTTTSALSGALPTADAAGDSRATGDGLSSASSIPPASKVPGGSTLPPFSFSKRPVDEYLNKSRGSSSSEVAEARSTFHSHISDIIPSSNRKSAGSRSSGDSAIPDKYRDINYDEQIRFPQMNNMNYYTYAGRSGRPSYSSNSSDRSIKSADSARKPQDQSQKTSKEKGGPTRDYRPAAFDLSQPLRRFSIPVEKEDVLFDIRPEGEPQDENFKLLKEYIVNNYIYEKNSEQAKLNRKISNYISEHGLRTPAEASSGKKPPGVKHPFCSTTSIRTAAPEVSSGESSRKPSRATRTPSSTSTSSSNSGPISEDTTLAHGATSFNQLYQMKKPMCTPAVLRPMVSSTALSDTGPTSPQDSLEAESPQKSKGRSPINNSIYTITSPTIPDGFSFPDSAEEDENSLNDTESERSVPPQTFDVEPTHLHWKPNTYSSHCMQCFKTFGNSILSLFYAFFDGKKEGESDSKSPGSTSGPLMGPAPGLSGPIRRHHCRFCGYIYCDTCLIQNDNDEASKRNVTARIYTTPRGKFMSSGILLDQNARFVIPIYKNAERTPPGDARTEGTQLALITDPENYKLFKICKNCGEIYKNLVLDLNKSASEATAGDPDTASGMLQKFPYVFIENPYVNALKADNHPPRPSSQRRPSNQPVMLDSYSSAQLDPHGGFSRKNSANEVPADWTWSSF